MTQIKSNARRSSSVKSAEKPARRAKPAAAGARTSSPGAKRASAPRAAPSKSAAGPGARAKSAAPRTRAGGDGPARSTTRGDGPARKSGDGPMRKMGDSPVRSKTYSDGPARPSRSKLGGDAPARPARSKTSGDAPRPARIKVLGDAPRRSRAPSDAPPRPARIARGKTLSAGLARPRFMGDAPPRPARERTPGDAPRKSAGGAGVIRAKPVRAARGEKAEGKPAARGSALRSAYGAAKTAPATPAPVERQEVRLVTIDANSDGQRLDNFLIRELGGVPKSHIYRLLRSGQVRVDGGRVKADRRLSSAEVVRIPPVRLQAPGEVVRPPDRVLNELREAVIFEDDHYLALNKPNGLSAHGGTGQLYGVIEAVRAWEKYGFIELCHRLDRDTSGVLLLAKSRNALLRAQRAFKDGDIVKRYFTLLIGEWRGEDRDVDAALVKVRLGDQHHVQLDEEGKPSKSRFSPREKFRNSTLCEVEIFSGRTHQIRVHALALGHAVVGDAKYGERSDNAPFKKLGLKRMFLHSHYLQIPADENFPRLLLNAEMPSELRDFLPKLPHATKGATGKRKK